MDIQTPDHTPPRSAGSPGQPSPNFIAHVMQTLGAATDQQRDATRELFEALDPRDPADAQLAAIAVAAAQSAMDNFARAARPGVSDETAVRLRGSALAAGRAYATALRYLRKPQAMAAQPAKPARSRATPASAPSPACGTRRRDTGNSTRLHRAATRRHADPRRVPPAGSLRQRDPGLAPRSDDPRAGACRVLLSPAIPPRSPQRSQEEAAMMAKQPKPDTPASPMYRLPAARGDRHAVDLPSPSPRRPRQPSGLRA